MGADVVLGKCSKCGHADCPGASGRQCILEYDEFPTKKLNNAIGNPLPKWTHQELLKCFQRHKGTGGEQPAAGGGRNPASGPKNKKTAAAAELDGTPEPESAAEAGQQTNGVQNYLQICESNIPRACMFDIIVINANILRSRIHTKPSAA